MDIRKRRLSNNISKKKISKITILWLIGIMFFGIIVGGLATHEAKAFVFGSANQITQWIKDATTVRLRVETNNLRVGSTGTLFVDTSLGRVGINTTTPSYKLHLLTGTDYGFVHSNGTIIGVHTPEQINSFSVQYPIILCRFIPIMATHKHNFRRMVISGWTQMSFM